MSFLVHATECHDVFRVVVLLIDDFHLVDEYLMLVLSKELDEAFGTVPMDKSSVGDVVLEVR